MTYSSRDFAVKIAELIDKTSSLTPWTMKKTYPDPPSCEEEEQLRLLADTDLGDVEEEGAVGDIEAAMRSATNHMIQGGSLPDAILLSPRAYAELERVVTKDQDVFLRCSHW